MLNRAVFILALLSGCVFYYAYGTEALSTQTASCSASLSAASCNGYTIEACANNDETWYQADGNYICSYTDGSSSCVNQVVKNYCNRSATKNTLTTRNSNKLHSLLDS